MRPRSLAVAAVLVLSAAASASAMAHLGPEGGGPGPARVPSVPGSATFVLAGSGYGHGVGLSQYGARAQALAGRSVSDILGFYYPRTTLGASTKVAIRVLLAPAVPTLTISSTADFSVRDGVGVSHAIPAGDLTLGPDLSVPVDGVPTALAGPLTFSPHSGALLQLGGKPYRGRLEIASTGAALQAIDVVSLEGYVRGVVPAEMPSSWPAAALEAQAVAARSYALADAVQGKAWDLYPAGGGQQYRGASAETPQATAAVNATSHQVLLFGGAVALTLYSASNGGQTASAADTFGLDIPYLPSQPDPWDAESPYHAWPLVSYTGLQLAKALGARSPVVEVRSRISLSLRVTTIVAISSDGSSLELSGSEARKRLRLRSTAFRLGTLRFVTQPSPATVGTRVRLAGLARDVDGATLERLDATGVWVTVLRRLPIQSDGSFAAVVKPTQTTTYRLSAAGIAGPELTIPVVAPAA